MGQRLNRSGVPITRGQEAVAPPIEIPEPPDLSGYAHTGDLDAVRGQLEGAIATRASGSSVVALALAMPIITPDTPLTEKTGGDPGVDGMKVPGAKHRHPHLTSTTGNLPAPAQPTHVIGADGRATIHFTRTFDLPPGPNFTEVPPIPATAMSDYPAIFRVEAWTVENGVIVGCTVRCWRSRPLPVLNALTGVLTLTGVNAIVAALTGFNIFAASAAGTSFTAIMVARSDG